MGTSLPGTLWVDTVLFHWLLQLLPYPRNPGFALAPLNGSQDDPTPCPRETPHSSCPSASKTAGLSPCIPLHTVMWSFSFPRSESGSSTLDHLTAVTDRSSWEAPLTGFEMKEVATQIPLHRNVLTYPLTLLSDSLFLASTWTLGSRKSVYSL